MFLGVSDPYGFVSSRTTNFFAIIPFRKFTYRTLLRLLLPLNENAWRTSHNVTSKGPLTSSWSENFTRPFNCAMCSKTWWFVKFCNSHYVSHFAAFFIVARTKISVAKSCLLYYISSLREGILVKVFMGCLQLPPCLTRGVRRGKRWFDITTPCRIIAISSPQGNKPPLQCSPLIIAIKLVRKVMAITLCFITFWSWVLFCVTCWVSILMDTLTYTSLVSMSIPLR